MKFLARHDSLIAIVGTAVLTIAYFWGVIQPGRTTAKQVEAEIKSAEERIGNVPQIVTERSQLQKQLEKQRERFEQVDAALPSDSHVSEVLHQIASLGRQAGLVIARLEPLPTLECASYTAHPFHLSCNGSFEDITEFLRSLESQSRLITFGNVDFSRGNDGPEPDGANRTIQASIDFSVYSRNANSTTLAENTIRHQSRSSDN